MNRTPFILLAALLLLSVRCSDRRANTEEELAEYIFEAIRDQDTAQLARYAIKESDGDYLLDRLNLPKDERPYIRKAIRFQVDYWATTTTKQIHTLRSIGRQNGIDWKTVAYDSIVKKTVVRDSIWKSDIYIYFPPNRQGTIGYLKLDDCLKTERGWVLYDGMQLRF